MRTIGRGTGLKDPTLAMSMAAIPWTGSGHSTNRRSTTSMSTPAPDGNQGDALGLRGNLCDGNRAEIDLGGFTLQSYCL
jgi:hypothetical protein